MLDLGLRKTQKKKNHTCTKALKKVKMGNRVRLTFEKKKKRIIAETSITTGEKGIRRAGIVYRNEQTSCGKDSRPFFEFRRAGDQETGGAGYLKTLYRTFCEEEEEGLSTMLVTVSPFQKGGGGF